MPSISDLRIPSQRNACDIQGILILEYIWIYRHAAKIVQQSFTVYVSPVYLTHIAMVVRESTPRQVDKKSGGPQGERGLDSQGGGKEKHFFFPSTFLSFI